MFVLAAVSCITLMALDNVWVPMDASIVSAPLPEFWAASLRDALTFSFRPG